MRANGEGASVARRNVLRDDAHGCERRGGSTFVHVKLSREKLRGLPAWVALPSLDVGQVRRENWRERSWLGGQPLTSLSKPPLSVYVHHPALLPLLVLYLFTAPGRAT